MLTLDFQEVTTRQKIFFSGRHTYETFSTHMTVTVPDDQKFLVSFCFYGIKFVVEEFGPKEFVKSLLPLLGPFWQLHL